MGPSRRLISLAQRGRVARESTRAAISSVFTKRAEWSMAFYWRETKDAHPEDQKLSAMAELCQRCVAPGDRLLQPFGALRVVARCMLVIFDTAVGRHSLRALKPEREGF